MNTILLQPNMALCFFSSSRPFSPLISCHASSISAAATTVTRRQSYPPPSQSPPSLPLNPSSTEPSLNCALQCQHFDSCSGCTHEFDLHRPIIVDEATDFFSRLYGWRCRAKLAVRGSSQDPQIGLYQEGTHNVVDIPNCQAHHPNINAAIELLKQGITSLSIEPYDEDEGTGDLRYVQMAVTTYSTSIPAKERYRKGKVQVALVWNARNENSPTSDKLNDLSDFLWRNGGPRSKFHLIHSVWANFQTSTNNIIFGNRWRHLLGERDFWEHVGGIDISLDPSSFGQANTKKLHKYVPYGSSVTDMYAGGGVIGVSLAVSKKCRSVKCVEINKESKFSFEKTVSRLPPSLDSSISWHQADTSTDPIFWLMGSDVAVVDPPRKGMDPSLLDVLQNISLYKRKAAKSTESSSLKAKDEKRPWVIRAKEGSVKVESITPYEETNSLPQTLIYISCGWDSFKEDCKALLSSEAWHLHKAHGFNFFPGTQSIEVLAIFRRGKGVGVKKKRTGKNRAVSMGSVASRR